MSGTFFCGPLVSIGPVKKCFDNDTIVFQEIVRLIIQAEVIIARNLSLKSKFTDNLLDRQDAAEELQHFVASILQNSEVAVRGGPLGPAGTAIQKLFLAAQKVCLLKLL